MNKKILSAILFGALVVSSTGSFVSCKDYDGDIENLQAQITANSATIAELKALTAKGVVITSITQDGSGVKVVTSDGKTYSITNGTNGQNGKDGKDADVWTIGEDGFWYLNGVKQNYKAVGTDGVNGTNGTNGSNGADGKDGIFYYPNNDGFFHVVDGDTDTKTDIFWKNTQGGMTAIQTETAVKFYDAEGKEVATISTVAALKALVFEPQLVVDGVPAIKAGALTFGGQTLCTPNVTASYYMNPSIVKEAGLKKETVSYVCLTKDFKSTRAVTGITASYNDIKDGKLIVNIDNINGAISEGDQIDLVALQVENSEGEVITSDFETITSDEIQAEDFYIARKNMLDVHYPGYHGNLNGTPNTNSSREQSIFPANDEAIAGYVAEQHAVHHKDVTDEQYATDNSTVIEIPYNETTDLAEYVAMCYVNSEKHNDWTKNMEAYKLSFKFDAVRVEKYLRSEAGLKETTDQQQFVTINGSKVTPKTYTLDGEQRSSVGRTPLVNVQLVFDNKTVIKNAYIALHIVEKAPEVVPETIYVDKEEIIEKAEAKIAEITVDEKFTGWNFKCLDSNPVNITAQQMNEKVYSLVNTSATDFAKNYNPKYSSVLGSTIALSDNNTSGQGDKSYGLTWTLTNAYMWANAGKLVSDYIEFVQAANPSIVPATDKEPTVTTETKNGQVIITTTTYKYKIINSVKVVLLAAEELPVLPEAVDVSAAEYEKKADYWKLNTSIAPTETIKNYIELNVKVPGVGDTDPTHAIFEHDLNDGFWSNPSEAVKQLFQDSPYKDLVNQNNVTIEREIRGAYVNGDKLTPAQLSGILSISGDIVVLNKNSNVAKQYLNSNTFAVEYGYKVTVKTDCEGIGDITEKAVTKTTPSFFTKYVKPINLNPKSAGGKFVDEENAGTLGFTVLRAESVVAMEDWRGKAVDITKPVTEEAGWLAKYYGVENQVGIGDGTIEVVYTDKTISITDSKNVVYAGIFGVPYDGQNLYPANMPQAVKDAITVAANNEAGKFFWYWNNGQKLQNEISINFPVSVKYTWGSTTETITVTVAPTKAIN